MREHPGSRWAAQGAGLLLIPRAALASGAPIGLPPEDVLATFPDEDWAPLPPAESAAAQALGARWLLAAQRSDGTWPSPPELEDNGSQRNEISRAIDGLCARALLARADVPGCRAASGKALRTYLDRRADTRPTAPLAMDYSAWSLWAWIEFLIDALDAELLGKDELGAVAGELVEELAALQRSNGGWSYFLSTSFEVDAPRLEQSISFMTAPIVLALVRALDAGVDVDESVLEHGLACLAAMRGENGTFAYMLWPSQPAGQGEALVAGAAGRSPLCELALLRGGRSDLERLRGALELFSRHAATLEHERGKALMHAGPEGQGCHYVLFDYATAAQATCELPGAERARWRTRLSSLLLATRRADGAFLDTPILGPAYGTAIALPALDALVLPDSEASK